MEVSRCSTEEQAIKERCEANNVTYIEPNDSVTDEVRLKRLRNAIKKSQRKKRQSKESPVQRRQRLDKKTESKNQRLAKESSLEKEQRLDREALLKRQRRASLSPSQKKQCTQSNYNQKNSKGPDSNSRLASLNPEIVEPINVETEGPIRNAISVMSRTLRDHCHFKASVCVICDRFIIGVEKVHSLTKERILLNSHRISVKMYEDFYSINMHPNLVQQYEIDDIKGLLLSPRSHRTEDSFECCSACFDALKPCRAKDSNRPPKHAIANGFSFGHVPRVIHVKGEDTPRQTDLTNDMISDIMGPSLAAQRAHGFVFAFTGGAQKSLMGSYHFFDVDQSHVGAVINHYRSTGANDHIVCALCGRMTPNQKERAREMSSLNTKMYIDLLTWLICESGHHGYKNLTPPDECPQPIILQDRDNDGNTDISVDMHKESQFSSGFTFTSSSDPTESTGVYRNQTDFTMAVLNGEPPSLIVHGGEYVHGSKLRLELIFPLQFPFGFGGPTMKRPTPISQLAILQHYMRLSLPQFQRGDFKLVVLNMFNRMRSYETGLITSRSTRIHGRPFAEVVSTLTEKQIKEAADKRTNNIDDSSIAGEFLSRVEISCAALGYTAAAAKKNRRFMFAMCDRFGLPSLFFTLTPDDELSIRVRMYADAGNEITMPSLKSSNDDCVADFILRRDARLRYPGACALDYESIVQVLVGILFAWDSEKQEGKVGIFGKLLAYSGAHEEQGKKTLHGHWLLWIDGFKKMRELLFHAQREVRAAARMEFKRYVDQVMCSAFGDGKDGSSRLLDVMHYCGTKESATTEGSPASGRGPGVVVVGALCDAPDHARTGQGLVDNDQRDVDRATRTSASNVETNKADKLFFDCKDGSADEKAQLQLIRNTRNKYKKDEIRGEIISCNKCKAKFSTQEIIDMSLQFHKQTTGSNIALPIHANRLDVATYRYPYDYGKPDVHEELFWNSPEVRRILLRMRVDNHDWNHRRSCFKGGPECRFDFAKRSQQETCLHVEEASENVVQWYRLDQGIHFESTPFMVLTRRPMGCQFLNTHNVAASTVFGCNTNVQIGEPCHIYYNAAYAFKDTQKEDSERFLRIGTQVIRRLRRMEAIARENAIIALGTETSGLDVEDFEEKKSDEEQRDLDFTEGLSRILSGINACLAKAVCSSTMAHYLVSNNGSRFQYSHQFANLLVSQAIDVMCGKSGQFRLVTSWDKTRKEKVFWADSTWDDYLNRPEELENVCLYEFVMRYEKVLKKFKEMDNTDNNGDDTNDTLNTPRQKRYRFLDSHPGFGFSYLQERKHEVIPIISAPKGSLCRMKDLDLSSRQTSNSVILDNREMYAETALTMFLPMRSRTDIMSKVDDNFWTKLMESIDDGEFCPIGLEVLQNIDDRATAEKSKSATEPLLACTTYEKSEEEKMSSGKQNEKDSSNPDAIDFSMFDYPADDYRINEGYSQRCERTHSHLTNLADVDKDQLIPARIAGHDSIFTPQQQTHAVTTQPGASTRTETNTGRNQQTYPTLLTFISGALVGGNYDNYPDSDKNTDNENVSRDNNIFQSSDNSTFQDIPTLNGVASKIARVEGKILDEKQYIAYEIIACSFLLMLVNMGPLTHSSTFRDMDPQEKESLKIQLKARGGEEQLIMFLTGFAGAGKSTCVKISQRFCYEFCRAVSIPWNSDTFLFTATTGSAASLFEGRTIHDVAFLSGLEKNITNKKRQEWQHVRILVIDEISFFTRANLEKLDRHLKNILGRQDLPFGGMSIVYSGDFHQLRPVNCENDGILYAGVLNGIFEGRINVAIILENSHRFDEDPEYGACMKRLWQGDLTEMDIDYINTREVGKNGLSLPDIDLDSDITYGCPFNRQRNATSAGIFQAHLSSTDFPPVNSSELPPTHTLIVEADIQSSTSSNKRSGTTKVNQEICDRIRNTCGDSHCVAGKSKKVDPCLRLYIGAHVMCNDNSRLKTDNVGNGTLGRVKEIKLKIGAPSPSWKNWEGKKVNTISARHIEHIIIERFPYSKDVVALKSSIQELEQDRLLMLAGSNGQENIELRTLDTKIAKMNQLLNEKKAKRCFKLSPTSSSCNVKVKLDDFPSSEVEYHSVNIFQLPINMNDATTGHKLQGMSKDNLIVTSWTFVENWIYVMLSRVRTLKGLFLLKPIPKNQMDKFQVPRDLQAFERRMRVLQDSVLNARKIKMAALTKNNI